MSVSTRRKPRSRPPQQRINVAKRDRLALLERLAAKEHDISTAWESTQLRRTAPPQAHKVAKLDHEFHTLIRQLFVAGDVQTNGAGHFVGSHFVPRGEWGHQLPGLPVPDLLCVYPTVISCVTPYRTEDEFVRMHGVTVEQMARLAEIGAVVIDLNSYISDKRRKFKAYSGSCPKLEHLMDSAQCCIHAIRLDAFLRTATRAKLDEAGTEKRVDALFSAALIAMSPQDRNVVFYNDNLPGAITATSRRLLYLRSLSQLDEHAAHWLRRFDQLPSTALTPADASRWLRELAGIKQYLATPFTAAFGGYTNYRVVDWTLFCELWGSSARERMPENKRRRPVGDGIVRSGWQAILKVIREFAEGRLRAKDMNTVDLSDESAFENFLAWVRDADARSRSLTLIDELHDELVDVYDGNMTADILREKLRNIAKNKQLLPSATIVASTVLLNALGGTVSIATQGWDSEGLMTAAAISTTLGGVALLSERVKGWITRKLMSARRVAIADSLTTFADAQRKLHRRIYA